MSNNLNLVIETFAGISDNFTKLQELSGKVVEAADLMIASLRAGGKVMFCGNGGSAADSQHLAAELMGRFMRDRAPLAALALTVDTSALTAIGNDYGYRDVFSRQLRGVGRAGDVLVGLSTSGNSTNVVDAMNVARQMGIHTIALTGAKEGAMVPLSDLWLPVPSTMTARIQEMHIAVGHTICELVENAMAPVG
ncbi:D-sedoheptulose 7-phosphate isomerase [Niveispirillum sp. BGYR6]|uniref:D-sedoheptulose-7-phosphate isomerase n=1 Tax=Niveispirillum sp. BGYR6 TaxID=2971249 RepID=UPI0022B9B784|nr:D-sedoheptulose 7-phosphate isomerase [Niveispirillum sp. BGYR6]MDG5497428.1 D-sedoheptulose 7-phosphate isomerase [Niveispirillum sp. BGYR6]